MKHTFTFDVNFSTCWFISVSRDPVQLKRLPARTLCPLVTEIGRSGNCPCTHNAHTLYTSPVYTLYTYSVYTVHILSQLYIYLFQVHSWLTYEWKTVIFWWYLHKRDAENTILNTWSKTDLAFYWTCSEPIRVSWLLWFHDRHMKPKQSADPYLFVAYWENS